MDPEPSYLGHPTYELRRTPCIGTSQNSYSTTFVNIKGHRISVRKLSQAPKVGPPDSKPL
jgi:hypothetical protein